jgi:hypothetical protein
VFFGGFRIPWGSGHRICYHSEAEGCQSIGEIELQYSSWDQLGKIAFTGFPTRDRMVSFEDATLNVKAKFVATEKENDKAPTIASSPVPSNSAPPGRRPLANISQSSSTIRAFRPRFTPPW